MKDRFESFALDASGPIEGGFSITPNDSANLPEVTRALYIGEGGSLRCTTNDGQTLTFSGLMPGTLLPIRATRVHASGTTATAVLGLV